MLQPTHIAETALYVDDLDRAARFYTGILHAIREVLRLAALHSRFLFVISLRGSACIRAILHLPRRR